MGRTIVVVFSLLVSSGCALLTETDCRADAAGWQWRGAYDAVQGDQPWIEACAKHCDAYGTTVDNESYLKGWEIGHAEFERRVNIAD
jgi:hypothetical protein